MRPRLMNSLRRVAIFDVILLTALVVIGAIFICPPSGVLVLSAPVTLAFWHGLHLILVLYAFLADLCFFGILATVTALIVACVDVYVGVYRATLIDLTSACEVTMLVFDVLFFMTAVIYLKSSCFTIDFYTSPNESELLLGDLDDDTKESLASRSVYTGRPISTTVQRRSQLKYGVAATP